MEKPLSTYNVWGEYKYVNSGFLMGPVGAMNKVLACMREVTPMDDGYDDQYALTQCMFRHPELITIDYSGSLILTMDGFQDSILVKHGAELRNVALNKTQCFIHFNSGLLSTMEDKWGLRPDVESEES